MLKGLFLTIHPKTGLYAFVVVLLGFNFYPNPDWVQAIIIAVTICFITWSIMSFNDLIDREHDCSKGKTFASQHSRELFIFWVGLGAVVTTGIIVSATSNVAVALVSGLVWACGILYSFCRRLVLVQNWMVAVCSGSPILIAGFYYSQISTDHILIFFSIVVLVAIKETYLDIRDREIDRGYKRTLSSESSTAYVNALMYTIVLMMVFGGLLVNCSAFPVKVTGFSIAPFAGLTAAMFRRPWLALQVSRYIDLVILLVLVSTFISQF